MATKRLTQAKRPQNPQQVPQQRPSSGALYLRRLESRIANLDADAGARGGVANQSAHPIASRRAAFALASAASVDRSTPKSSRPSFRMRPAASAWLARNGGPANPALTLEQQAISPLEMNASGLAPDTTAPLVPIVPHRFAASNRGAAACCQRHDHDRFVAAARIARWRCCATVFLSEQ